MKKLIASKKLTRKNLRHIIGAEKKVCCQTYCDTGECALWGYPPALCPEVPGCG